MATFQMNLNQVSEHKTQNLRPSSSRKSGLQAAASAVLLASFVLLSACGEKKKDGVQVQTGRTAVPGSPGTANQMVSGSSVQLSNGTVIAGIVYADPVHQSIFQQAVEKLLEPMVSPDNVGDVSSVGANGTGIFLGGAMTVSQAGMQANGLTGNSTAQINAGGGLTVLVYDDYAYQPSITGGTSVQAIARIYRVESGTVTGTNARVTLADGSGRIELSGQFSNGRFFGKFFFRNNVMQEAGTLGDFVIPTCQLFRCQ